jgi:hypothetical protein
VSTRALWRLFFVFAFAAAGGQLVAAIVHLGMVAGWRR